MHPSIAKSIPVFLILESLGCNALPIKQFSVAGSVSGLVGTLVVKNNNTDSVTLTQNGPFVFSTHLNLGQPYAVTVATQPDHQACEVGHGSGLVATDVTDVLVTCTMLHYKMSVTVTG